MSRTDIYTKLSENFNSIYSDIDLTEYFDFCISKSLPQKIKFETANHHILPQWAFPQYKQFNNYPWNKAILYHKDHLMAHFLLWDAWKKAENASPLILMCNTNKNITTEFIEIYSDLYQMACIEHAKNTSVKHKGKILSKETKDKISQARKNNSHKGMYNCIEILTGEIVHIPVEKYKEFKNILYKSVVADKPSWNSGIEVLNNKGKITVILNETNDKIRITTDEFYKNRNLYTHLQEGSSRESIKDFVHVTEVSSGNKLKITTEEYSANKDKYIFHAQNTKWVNNGIKSLRINDTDEIPEGYSLGRLTFKVTHPDRKCPHCGLVGKGSNMSRYHFDNCKSKFS